MKISVVVPNWNGAEFLADSLRSIENQSLEADIIVVDNGSTDDSINIIEKSFPKVILLKNSVNLGFSGGVNIGINYALENGSEYIALFNNDAIAEPDWLDKLMKRMVSDEKIGVVTCKFKRFDKKHFDSTGDFYTTRGVPFPRGRNLEDKGQFDVAGPVFSASGGASLFRSKTLNEVGLMDERFFAYIEDVDLGFRTQLAGWEVWYEPEAVAYHRVSATTSKMVSSFSRYHWIKNFLMTYTKNMPTLLYWKYFPLFIFQYLRYGISSIVRGGFWAYLRSTARFIVLLPGVLKDRHLIQKKRRVTAKQIDELLVHSRPPRIPEI